MSIYYKVCASFIFAKNKPQLISVNFYTTSEYFPILISSCNSPFISRYFHTVPEAENYINYLFSRYPDTTAERPILDADQLLLF